MHVYDVNNLIQCMHLYMCYICVCIYICVLCKRSVVYLSTQSCVMALIVRKLKLMNKVRFTSIYILFVHCMSQKNPTYPVFCFKAVLISIANKLSI